MKSEIFKILWDFTIQCDQKTEARRPDIVFIDKKKREVVMINVAIPGDDRVKEKELEKVEKYQLLKDEIANYCVVIGALGAVSASQLQGVHEVNRSECEVGSHPENSIVVDRAKIVRKVLSLKAEGK